MKKKVERNRDYKDIATENEHALLITIFVVGTLVNVLLVIVGYLLSN